jgi:epoxyqueuosine reductase
MKSEIHTVSDRIRKLALDIGFTACGFAPVSEMKKDAKQLRRWLDEGMHAGMHYMQNHFEKRTHPGLLVPGTKSAIVLLLNYYPEKEIEGKTSKLISKYAYGRDYHKIMKRMLKNLYQRIREEIHPVQGRFFVDSAPVLERSLAARAGLGWIGRNSNLVSKELGSFFFIGELFVDIELAFVDSLPDYCGSCTKCISACPTEAILLNRTVDSNKCISYWTIEHKGEIDPELKGKFENRIFGCDICQDVCPWNSRSKKTSITEFNASQDLLQMTDKDWETLTEDSFDKLFPGSAVQRTGYTGIKKNVQFVSEA